MKRLDPARVFSHNIWRYGLSQPHFIPGAQISPYGDLAWQREATWLECVFW
jgi:hypothetical protein